MKLSINQISNSFCQILESLEKLTPGVVFSVSKFSPLQRHHSKFCFDRQFHLVIFNDQYYVRLLAQNMKDLEQTARHVLSQLEIVFKKFVKVSVG